MKTEQEIIRVKKILELAPESRSMGENMFLATFTEEELNALKPEEVPPEVEVPVEKQDTQPEAVEEQKEEEEEEEEEEALTMPLGSFLGLIKNYEDNSKIVNIAGGVYPAVWKEFSEIFSEDYREMEVPITVTQENLEIFNELIEKLKTS